MPRKSASGAATSAFQQVQRQAKKLLVNLRKDIRAMEMKLGRLKQEEARLGHLIGRSSAGTERSSSSAWAAPAATTPQRVRRRISISNREICA